MHCSKIQTLKTFNRQSLSDVPTQRPTLRSSAFPVSLQIMVALRYYATGSCQSVIGDVHHISRQSVSYILQDVTECLNNVAKQYIYMPTNEDHLNKIKRDFHDIAQWVQ